MKTIRHDNDNGICEAELQGYVDGQLAPGRRAAVEAYLATSPLEWERLAAYRRQNVALHALFDGQSAEEPDRLPPAIAQQAIELEDRLRGASETAPGQDLRRLAAAVVLLLAAGGAGWAALDGYRPGGSQETLLPAALEAAPPPTIIPDRHETAPPQEGEDRPEET